MRQLIHALKGSLTTFYLPTFFEDLVITGNIISGSSQVLIANIGYSEQIASRAPNNAIWIELNDGTIIMRTIIDSEVVDEDTERLTMDETWDDDVSSSEIKRTSFLRLCRIDNDRVDFEHNGSGKSTAEMQVLGVFQ